MCRGLSAGESREGGHVELLHINIRKLMIFRKGTPVINLEDKCWLGALGVKKDWTWG